MDILIIGAGASGMVAGIKAQENGAKVTIIEKNNKPGKKLLVTGNGRCNYWNGNQSLDKYHSNDRDLMEEIINLKKDEVLSFFDDLGIVPRVINNNYYPYSNQAISIVNALVNKIKKLKINLKLEEEVKEIRKDDKFRVKTSKGNYVFDKVIIATGGKSYPKTGSDGFGLMLAKSFGHTINKVYPALTQVYGKDNFYKDFEGVRSEAILTLEENGLIIKKEQGEVQFTKKGISGICTFNLSGIIAKGLEEGNKEVIYINLVPWFKGDLKEFILFMDERNKRLKDYTIKEILEGFLNYKLVNLILKITNTNENANWDKVNKELVGEKLINFKLDIMGTGDFDLAQVSKGGVSLKEINPYTLESKLIKGLYFTGEVLDVDGDCGGYNLGFAWISGLIVGDNIND